jgi:geranylgeranyl pyrophosphate synthase
MIRLQESQPVQQTRSYVHLMRAAARIFEADEMERLVPRQRGGPRLAETNGRGLQGLDPVAGTEAVAYDFLCRGGKRARPFITLAVYDALTGGHATLPSGQRHLETFADGVWRTAMSIEAFHKASLVHDDIEDDDAFRYGDDTLHRRYGIPTAINVGDYLIGMGYRLVSREVKTLGADVVAEILAHLADAHTRLSEGQGAELLWRDAREKRLSPIDALKIYTPKTAPAFEAALLSGVRLAGPADVHSEAMRQFARNVGVAFQILNDLKDWEGDTNNKLSAGGDILGGRPTLLLALALEALPPEDQAELLALIATQGHGADYRFRRVGQLYRQAHVFEKARRLVDKHQQRAEAIADGVQPDELRRLLYYLIDSVLERSTEESPMVPSASPLVTLAVVNPTH